LTLAKKLKIPLSTHSSGSQVILDDEYRNTAVFRNHNGTQYTVLCEDHVISFLSRN